MLCGIAAGLLDGKNAGMRDHRDACRLGGDGVEGGMSNVIDKGYFLELAGRDPREICGRTSCTYNAEESSFVLTAWGDEYAIYPREGRIEFTAGHIYRPRALFSLFMVYYLLRSTGASPCGEWISEKDLPGGPTFFRGPHEIPTRLIPERFGNDIEAFGKKCTQLSGTPLEMADAAYRFEIVSNIPVAVLFWTGDDEFPSEAKIMFDRTLTQHLTLDIIFSLAVEVCARIAGGEETT